MEFRDVVDIAMVLVTEVYREVGIHFQEAIQTLGEKLGDPVRAAAREPDNETSMAMLMGMMGGSSFKGPKG